MSSASAKETWIDGSLYPDQEVPQSLPGEPAKIDFLVRVCAAWDFGMPPKEGVFSEITKPHWKPIVEKAEVLTSCAYHVLRELHKLEERPYLGPRFPKVEQDPWLEYL